VEADAPDEQNGYGHQDHHFAIWLTPNGESNEQCDGYRRQFLRVHTQKDPQPVEDSSSPRFFESFKLTIVGFQLTSAHCSS